MLYTRIGQVALLFLEILLQILTVPWHDHVGEELLFSDLLVVEEDHTVLNDLWGGVVGVLILLLIDFPHGIDLISELFVIVRDLDNEGSILI